ncbi:MAG: hypothetical protein V4819_00930 [Verrucomicrobiota bacterium]
MLLPSCAPEKVQAPVRAPVTVASNVSRKKIDPFTIKPTPEQQAKAEAATDAYFRAMRKTIVELDDGRTSPDVIGRAAVSQNIILLREKVVAQSIHFKEESWIGEEVVNEKLAKLPESGDFDMATSMVLKLRQISATKTVGE